MTYAERRREEANEVKCLTCKHFKLGSNGDKGCSNLASSCFGSKLNPGEKCTMFTFAR